MLQSWPCASARPRAHTKAQRIRQAGCMRLEAIMQSRDFLRLEGIKEKMRDHYVI